MSLIHAALDTHLANTDKLECAFGSNNMPKEAANIQKNRNENRFLENGVAGFVLNQMSSKAGMHKHGDKVVQSLVTEIMKIEDDDTLMPFDSTILSR